MNAVAEVIYLHESFGNSSFAAKLLHTILHDWMMNSEIDKINQLYEDINFDAVSLMVMITLLRKTSVYKKEIPLWSYVILKAYGLCKRENTLPRKELYGLI